MADPISGIFALLAPAPALPPTLPRLPSPTLSPGSIIVTLLAGLGSYLATQPDPNQETDEQRRVREEEEEDDNKRVVKMFDVAYEIDKTLNSKILFPIIYRAMIAILKGQVGSGFTSWEDMGKFISDQEWEPIRVSLKQAIRQHLLQQNNPRKSRTTHSVERIGKLHVA